MLLLYSAIVNY